MEANQNRNIELYVKPKGEILNDSAHGVDHLEYSVYAKALAQQIEEATPPLTMGIFARWGGGKSHLLKHIKDVLERKQRQNVAIHNKSCDCSWRALCCLRLVFLFFFIFLITMACLWTISPTIFVPNEPIVNTSTVAAKPSMAHSSRFVALGVLFFCVTLTWVLTCCNSMFSSVKLRLIFYPTFTKLPKHSSQTPIVQDNLNGVGNIKLDPKRKKEQKKNNNTRYIFVNFNAWEYAGSDTLWAGIVTNLSKSIETEFGLVTSRLFRLLNVDDIDDVKKSSRAERSLHVYLPQMQNDKKVFEEIVKEHGVVKRIERIIDKPSRRKWWLVEYSNQQEAQKAYNFIKLHGIEVKKCEVDISCEDHCGTIDENENNENDTLMDGKMEADYDYQREGKKLIPSRWAKLCRFIRHFVRHPKTTCCLPNLFWWLLFYASFLAILCVITQIAEVFNLDIYRHGRAVPLIVQLIAWTPPAIAVLYVFVSFVWAMLHSQRKRIQTALKGTDGNLAAQLGFMNKVKTEVKIMTKMVKCAEFTQKNRYRVVIFIDDLDRVGQEKVKSVLEAVSILLSDHSSPFVCLVAVDSRVAVKSIEDAMSLSLVKSNVSGHEYLKKIINLPFCLPEVSNKVKKQYICGLISLSDETRRKRTETVDDNRNEITTDSANDEVDGIVSDKAINRNILDSLDNGVLKQAGEVLMSGMGRPQDNEEDILNHNEFVVACKNFLHDDNLVQRHLDGNLRSIKRICNVLSLTLWILHFHDKERNKEIFLLRNTRADQQEMEWSRGSVIKRTKQLARDLVTWVVLIDQWPYRMSYLLQIIEDTDDNPGIRTESFVIGDQTTLFDIYNNEVLSELQVLSLEENGCFPSLDVSPNLLYNYLKELKESKDIQLNKGKTDLLKQFTINLDQSLKQTIQFQRTTVRTKLSNNSQQQSLPRILDEA